MKSKLVAIINRLETMVENTDGEMQTRRFEHEGEVKCEVTFNTTEQVFFLHETATGFNSTYDDIDIVAMEIYDLIF